MPAFFDQTTQFTHEWEAKVSHAIEDDFLPSQGISRTGLIITLLNFSETKR